MRLRKLTFLGGLLAVLGGVGHLASSVVMRRDVWSEQLSDGVRGTVSLAPSGADLLFAEAFWFSVGSFAAPLIALGGWALSSYRHGQHVPGFVGWAIAGWAAAVGILGGFDSGTWVLIAVGALLGIGGYVGRADRDEVSGATSSTS